MRVHGGPDAAGVPLHDFSSNANACGPCPAALDAVRAADVSRYPDPAYTALRARLGARHGVAAERIAVAGSASEFIFRVSAFAARQGWRTVSLPEHSYGDYAAAAQAWGLEAGGAGQLCWLCEPSSPLGQAEMRSGEGARMAVLDCAYAPLRLDGGPPPRADAWQLWSPNKALGLTGVRGGYAVAPAGAQALVQAIDALSPSWVLGADGVAMLGAWCEPDVADSLATSLRTLAGWKASQEAVCTSLGWTVLPSIASFFACRVDDAARVARMRAHGVKLRDCASFGLPGHFRLGVLPPESQAALARAWEASA